MPALKILKNRSYYSRFQVKWRSRREGKTDYYSRKRMIYQDKRKFNSPKYRMVVRNFKRNIICQFVYSNLEGDMVMNCFYSRNLSSFGINFGLTNFSAAYLSGLILAKQVFTKKSKMIKENLSQKQFIPKKMKAILDIGLSNTTIGHKVFASMKGAVDGGIEIPHNEKKYPGYIPDKGFEPSVLNHRLKGKHIHDYIKILREEDEEKFFRYFSSYQKSNVTPDRFISLISSVTSKFLARK